MSEKHKLAFDLEILIVDDDRMICLLQEKSLLRTAVPYPILQFVNGQAALEHFRQHPKSIFLILLDINMPIMDGWEFLKLAEDLVRPQQLYTVMLTSSSSTFDKTKAESYRSIIAFFEKPLTLDKARNLQSLEAVKKFFE